MRLFDYFCDKCKKVFEQLINTSEIEKYLDNHPCPTCGETANRAVTAPARLVIPNDSGAIYSNPSNPEKD